MNLFSVVSTVPQMQTSRSTAEPAKDTSLQDFLAKLASFGCTADLAFVVFQAEIQKLNGQVTEALNTIQQTSAMRDAYSKKLAAMRNLQTLVMAASGNDTNAVVSSDALFNKFAEQNHSSVRAGDVYSKDPQKKADYLQLKAEFDRQFGPALGTPSIDKDGHVSLEGCPKPQTMPGTGNGSTALGATMVGNYTTSSADLDKQMETIKDDVRKFDSDRETQMIMLNTWMNKKSNAISQLTNLIKAQHDTEKTVINQLRVS